MVWISILSFWAPTSFKVVIVESPVVDHDCSIIFVNLDDTGSINIERSYVRALKD